MRKLWPILRCSPGFLLSETEENHKNYFPSPPLNSVIIISLTGELNDFVAPCRTSDLYSGTFLLFQVFVGLRVKLVMATVWSFGVQGLM
jgi:hypothetical protein